MTPEQRISLGRKIAAERVSAGLTQRELARRIHSAIHDTQKPDLDTLEGYVKRWEAGRAGIGRRYRRVLAQALKVDEAYLFGDASARSAAGTDGKRRNLLACLGFLSVEAAVTHEPLESLRLALYRTLPDGAHGRLVSDWEEVAFEHGHAFLTTSPEVLLPELAQDLVDLQHTIQAAEGESLRRSLCVPAGKLAALIAMTLASLGEPRKARDWWKTARHTADASPDRDLRVWVRGHEAMSALYARRPLPLVLRLADEAIAIAADSPGGAVLEAMAGRAQALALLGSRKEAEATLHAIEDRWNRLPQATPGERLSTGAWPATALHHTAAFTYTHTRNAKAAEREREAALALYPPTMCRQRAQIKLLRAVDLIKAGDIAGGVSYASQAVETLDSTQRTNTIRRGVQMVLESIPESERTRPDVSRYREILVSPGAHDQQQKGGPHAAG